MSELYSQYENDVKNYILSMCNDYEFDIQTTEFEFSNLTTQMKEIQNETMIAINIGVKVANSLTNLGFKEIIIEA